MRAKTMYVAVGAVVVAVLLGVVMPGCSAEEEQQSGPDYEALAEKLVNQCANVQEGDLVVIWGGVRDVELLENIAVHVRKHGAFPHVTLGSDRMTRRLYEDVPAKYDSQTPGFALKLAELMTVQIGVEFNETATLLADVPPERLAAVGNAYMPVADLTLERSVRQVYLGNGLYPTTERAQLFGVTQEQLSKIFWDGVNADYSDLEVTGQAVKAVLAEGKELHITNPNGTDLKVRIEGRPVFVTDGAISTDEVERGGAACQIWLPAGEVFVAPVAGTADGRVVIERHFFQGKEIQGLTLGFEAGKLTSMTAESGLEPLKELYDASGLGKDQFAVVDIGINPKVHIVPDSRMVAWMATGMITVGIGNNTWAGGENNASFGLYSFLPGSTLKVDGKIVVEDGTLGL